MKKILTFILALTLTLMGATPVMAEKYDSTAPIKEAHNTGTTSTTFDKYLVMKKEAQIPYADFLFEVTAPDPADSQDDEVYPEVLIPATNGTPSDVNPVVWKGVRPDKVVVTPAAGSDENVAANVGELTYSQADSAVDGPFRTGKADIATSKEKYVKKTITVSFANIKFAEPGVYRYYVQEKNGATYKDLGITYDVNANNSTWRTLDVYVLDDGSGNLYIADYVWYETKLGSSAQPSHTASATNENPWKVVWTDATDTTKTYEYVSNDIWNVKVNGTANGETVTEPPANATGSVTIDKKPYTTWGTAKAAMKEYQTKELTPNGAEAGDKSSEYVNKYGTEDLEFGKKVEGNQGSRDQWFKIKVTLSHADLIDGTKFEMNVGSYTSSNPANAAHFFDPTKNSATSYDATTMKTANTAQNDYKTAEFTAAKNTLPGTNFLQAKGGKVEWEMYLQHGQYVQIKGIPDGVTYTVEETDPATGYTKISGTDVPVGVIDGEEITNAHKDPLTGTVGSKTTKTYVKDAEGDFYKNGNAFNPLYIDGNKAYTDQAKTQEWSGDRYLQDENIYTGVTNKRSGIIPTGLLMSAGGGIALVLIALTLLTLMRRKRQMEED